MTDGLCLIKFHKPWPGLGLKKTRSVPWPLSNIPLTIPERGLWRGHSCYLAV